MKRNNQIVGNVGLYFTCHKLSLLGWNVMPTSRNARGIDIVAYRGISPQFLGIQVKTLSNRAAVSLGASLDKLMGDLWVIRNKIATDEPNVFIMTLEEVKRLATRNEKEGQASYWLEPKDYDTDEFRDAWHHFRCDDEMA